MTKVKFLKVLPLLLTLLSLTTTQFAFATEEIPADKQETALERTSSSPPLPEGSVVSGDQLYLDSSGGLQKKVPGVGSSLAGMLDRLISLTGGSESQMKQLFANLPILLPDLYKVFITL